MAGASDEDVRRLGELERRFQESEDHLKVERDKQSQLAIERDRSKLEWQQQTRDLQQEVLLAFV